MYLYALYCICSIGLGKGTPRQQGVHLTPGATRHRSEGALHSLQTDSCSVRPNSDENATPQGEEKTGRAGYELIAGIRTHSSRETYKRSFKTLYSTGGGTEEPSPNPKAIDRSMPSEQRPPLREVFRLHVL